MYETRYIACVHHGRGVHVEECAAHKEVFDKRRRGQCVCICLAVAQWMRIRLMWKSLHKIQHEPFCTVAFNNLNNIDEDFVCSSNHLLLNFWKGKKNNRRWTGAIHFFFENESICSTKEFSLCFLLIFANEFSFIRRIHLGHEEQSKWRQKQSVWCIVRLRCAVLCAVLRNAFVQMIRHYY